MNRRNAGEKKRSFLLGRRSKANQNGTPTRGGNRLVRGRRGTENGDGAKSTSTKSTTTTTTNKIIDEPEETTFFDRLLEVGDQKKALLIERRSRVEELEDTCLYMAEIVRIHNEQLEQARSKLAKRKQKLAMAAANGESVAARSDHDEEEEEEVMEELVSSIYEMEGNLDKLTSKYRRKKDFLTAAKRDLADYEAEEDGEMSILSQDADFTSPAKGSAPSTNPFDDVEDTKAGEASKNPFDSDEESHEPPPNAKGNVEEPANGVSDGPARAFCKISEALSKQNASNFAKHEFLEFLENERLEKQVAELSTQNEQTERAIHCLQKQIEESAEQNKLQQSQISRVGSLFTRN